LTFDTIDPRKRQKRLVQLRVRVRAVVDSLCESQVPPSVLNGLRAVTRDGTYFPDGFLFEYERQSLLFSAMGATRRMDEKSQHDRESRVELVIAGVLLVRTLLLRILLGSRDTKSSRNTMSTAGGHVKHGQESNERAKANYKAVAAVLFECMKRAFPDMAGVARGGAPLQAMASLNGASGSLSARRGHAAVDEQERTSRIPWLSELFGGALTGAQSDTRGQLGPLSTGRLSTDGGEGDRSNDGRAENQRTDEEDEEQSRFEHLSRTVGALDTVRKSGIDLVQFTGRLESFIQAIAQQVGALTSSSRVASVPDAKESQSNSSGMEETKSP